MKSQRRFFHPIQPTFSSESGAPTLAFSGRTRDDLTAWQGGFLKVLRKAVGAPRTKVPLHVETVERQELDGYVREKIVYDVEPDLSVAAWVCQPVTRTLEKFPAVLCCHGMGPGKSPLVGLNNDGTACLEYHKLVAVRLAQRGFLTIAPDRRGFGDCSQFPNGYPTFQNLVELNNFYQSTRGLSLPALDIADNLRAVDVLMERNDVETHHIGCLGVMEGATVAAGVAALDRRIGAASLTSFLDDSFKFPGPIQIPDLAGSAGSVEVCGLICPRPLQVQLPAGDPTIHVNDALRAAEKVRRMYELMNAAGQFAEHVFEGVVELEFPPVAEWMEKWLWDE